MSRELLQQALDALKVSAWDHIHAVGKQALIDAIIDRLAQPDAEPVAWKCAKCGNTSDCEGVTVGDNWCNSCAVCGEMKPLYATAPPAAPAPGDMVMVPLKFVQDFNTLAHNYCLRAVPPDYYSGTEADAFQHAYSRCGSDLRRLREILAAAPAPAEDFCYCNDDISLQIVSGGAAKEGLYGRVTLLIDGKYVDYVPAESANPAVPMTEEQIRSIYRKTLNQSLREQDTSVVLQFARAVLSAAPAVPAVCDGGTCGLGGYCTNCPRLSAAPAVPDLKHKPTVQRLMDLARKFRSAPGDLYDGAYKELQSACYEALSAAPVVREPQYWCPETGELCGKCAKTGTCEASILQAHGIGGGGK